MKNIEQIIRNTTESNQNKTNWAKAWSAKYPILKKYQKEIDIQKYSSKIRKLLNKLQAEYNYNELEAMLVLKDILAHEYLNEKNSTNYINLER